MVIWRWIDGGIEDGLTNMATDFAIAQNNIFPSIPTIRVYQWYPKCISLGFHQSVENINLSLCKEHKIEVVRRPTGGRAVFHTNEVTYAVSVPTQLSKYYIHELYSLISQGLVEGIRQLGIPAKFKKRTFDLRKHYQTLDGMSCFSTAARYEVTVHGRKLIGSAQRHFHQGVLQHGSIMLGREHLYLPDYYSGLSAQEKEQMKLKMQKNTISFEDCLERSCEYDTISDAIRYGMTKVFGIQFQDQGLSSKERNRIQALKSSFMV